MLVHRRICGVGNTSYTNRCTAKARQLTTTNCRAQPLRASMVPKSRLAAIGLESCQSERAQSATFGNGLRSPRMRRYCPAMASLWQEFVDTIDAQISVDDGLFWGTDLRALMALPLIPFLVVMFLAHPPSTAANVVGSAMLIFEVWWIIFLLRRRAAKKRNWVEPTRFSDENNGY